ncbi:hypothetical protein [Actinocrispum wychmicini]|uniref:FXSXX-COOH protein n=1 Tax=Actinocrispum wychmicini TaxID=1213861 RepID=A0A4R2JKX1_9PSEU|nr:hypothetical protein [Actinocrispum wychmicini]TCO59202.1 hypothetical protein EV192_10442 [Actinocrispum wychmicini]
MNTLSADSQQGITSNLIDLASVPLAVLRGLDNDELHRSVGHVVEQAGHPTMSKGNSSTVDAIH